MPTQYTYRDVTLSLWQSAAEQTMSNRQAAPMPGLNDAPVSNRGNRANGDLMAPAHLVGGPLSSGQPPPPPIVAGTAAAAPTDALAAKEVAGVVVDCVEVAAKFLWAEITGDKQSADLYAAELKFAECDALGWAECLTTYFAFKASLGSIPYRPNKDVVLPLPEQATIAIISDWGTGDAVARNLLEQVATFKPDTLLHLGDIYYAGTQSEVENNFLNLCHEVLGGGVQLFSLCGNHDVYSGGQAYYWLLDQIGQGSSYFCLQNDHWQFLAMDTGYNDNDPITVTTNMTGLVKTGSWSEAEWHVEKIKQAGNRRVALFSHHPFFSPFSSVGNVDGEPYAYNPNLLVDFASMLPKVDVWFWGHEHTLALYDPYLGLVRGRCVGGSAVPVFKDQQQYVADPGLIRGKVTELATWNPAAQLGDNGTDYNNDFAIMTLNGATAVVNYYEVPLLQPISQVPFTDTI